jgi:hypothetical protein
MPIVRSTVLALLLASSPVRAQPPEASTPGQHWYGWQVLAADGVGFSLIGIGVAADSTTATVVGLTAYLLSGAMVHSVHGKTRRAAGSALLLRPMAALAASGIAYDCSVWGCASVDGTTGTAFAVLAGGALIDAALGWESTRIAPIAQPDGTRGLALTGTF